jgi:hypothetical protein
LLARGIILIEYLVNLSAISGPTTMFMAAPLKSHHARRSEEPEIPAMENAAPLYSRTHRLTARHAGPFDR